MRLYIDKEDERVERKGGSCRERSCHIDNSSGLFGDSEQEQKISVIELESEMISVLEPSNLIIDPNKEVSAAIETVTEQDESSQFMKSTPKLDIVGDTPDWQTKAAVTAQEPQFVD